METNGFPRELDTNIIYKKSIFEFLNKLDKRIIKTTVAKYYLNNHKGFILKDLKKNLKR